MTSFSHTSYLLIIRFHQMILSYTFSVTDYIFRSLGHLFAFYKSVSWHPVKLSGAFKPLAYIRLKSMKTFIMRIALIGAENWKLRKRDYKYPKCFETSCCRTMQKIIWTDGVQNTVLQKSPLIFLEPRTSKAQLAVTLEVTVIKKEYFNTNTIILYM